VTNSVACAVTYTLGFYADANLLDGRFHELKVHVKRSGLQVRTRCGYFAQERPARYSIALTFPSMKVSFISAYT
jgi:hypothetical protein